LGDFFLVYNKFYLISRIAFAVYPTDLTVPGRWLNR